MQTEMQRTAVNSDHTPSTQGNRLLVLCGVSGSGKSTLEENLLERFPEYFHKLQQVTTRKPREGESPGKPYVFLQRSTYDIIKPSLIGRLGNSPDSLFKDKYGSFPDFVPGKISTVILAQEAILDLYQSINEKSIVIDSLFILGLDVAYENLDSESLRENRDAEFLAKERSVLNYANVVYRTDNGRYMNPMLVVRMLEDRKMLP